MRQQNSVDNGLIFAYDIARHSRASRKLGLGRLLGCLLTFAALLLLQGVICPSGYADYAGGFPGKGSRQVWLRANDVFNQGNNLRRAGEFAGAIPKFKRAIAIYPYDSDYYGALGLAYDGLKDFAKAEAAYKTAVKLNPQDWTNWYNLMNNLYDQHKYKESEAACLKALETNPPPARKAKLLKALETLRSKTGSVVGAQP